MPDITVTKAQVEQLIATHCLGCHSANPTDDIFVVAPSGVKFDSWEEIQRWSFSIVNRTAVSKDMPFLNKTKMTEEERQMIAAYFKQNPPNG